MLSTTARARARACGTRACSLAVSCAALLFHSACSRSTPPEPSSRERAPATEAPIPEEPSFRAPAAEHIVAFGDVHGDLQAARAVLRLAHAIDANDHWSGGNLVVVQTGDQLDRGDDDRAILDWFDRLRDEARSAGGAFHVLNGNHEVMNVSADFRYVTPRAFTAFTDQLSSDDAQRGRVERLPEEQRARGAAFLPGGAYAKRLAERPLVLAVGDNVFVHGGLLEQHVRYGLGRLNQETRRWMLGEAAAAPSILQSEQSPIWLRTYSNGLPTREQCAALGHTLDLLHAKRLVVGHTVQKSGINSACEGKVWRIDVGLSRYFGGTPSALDIRADHVQVLTGTLDAAREPAAIATASAPPVAPRVPRPARKSDRVAPPPAH